jgi:hypothetical protein
MNDAIESDALECFRKLDSQEAAIVRNLLKLVPVDKFNEACASSGVDADDASARFLAVLSKPAESKAKKKRGRK